MPLVLAVDRKTTSPPALLGLLTLTLTWRMGLRHEVSYYPGHSQTIHPLAAFPTVPPTVIQDLNTANSDDSSAKDEECFNDWHIAGLAGGPFIISGAQANERPPGWGPSNGQSTSTNVGAQGDLQANDIDISGANIYTWARASITSDTTGTQIAIVNPDKLDN